jgi:SAM-dependent methyltransferase
MGDYELHVARVVRRVLGIDLSAVAIGEARRRAEAAGLRNVEFRQGPVLDLAEPDGSFDVVYAMGVLHHLSVVERQALLVKARTWLAPGGVFYARDPNARGILRLAAARWTGGSRFHSPNEAAIDPALLHREVAAGGLTDVAVGYTDVLGGPLPWLLASRSRVLWSMVFAFDRFWIATPGLRALASQFDLRARR